MVVDERAGTGAVARVHGIEDGVVRLSADADVAVLDETEADGKPLD